MHESIYPSRRRFLTATGSILAASTVAGKIFGAGGAAAVNPPGENRNRIFKAIKFGDF